MAGSSDRGKRSVVAMVVERGLEAVSLLGGKARSQSRAKSSAGAGTSGSSTVVILDEDDDVLNVPNASKNASKKATAPKQWSDLGKEKKKRKRDAPGASGANGSPHEVIDLTVASPPTPQRPKDVPDVQILSTKNVKQRPPKRAYGAGLMPPSRMPDVFIDNSAFPVRCNNTIATTTAKASPEQEKKPECRICMCPFKEPHTTPCGHVFCKQCIYTSFRVKKECPMCRKKITRIGQIHRIFI